MNEDKKFKKDTPDNNKELVERGLKILQDLDHRDLREETAPPNLLVTLTPFWAFALGWVFIPEGAQAFVRFGFFGVCAILFLGLLYKHIKCYRSNLLLAASRKVYERRVLKEKIENFEKKDEAGEGAISEKFSVDSRKNIKGIKMPSEFK